MNHLLSGTQHLLFALAGLEVSDFSVRGVNPGSAEVSGRFAIDFNRPRISPVIFLYMKAN